MIRDGSGVVGWGLRGLGGVVSEWGMGGLGGVVGGVGRVGDRQWDRQGLRDVLLATTHKTERSLEQDWGAGHSREQRKFWAVW